MAAAALPFLTLPDPVASGEGILDPLGLASLGDRLADWILPGFTARMIRPRFLTAIAVSAVVCDGFDERVAKDGVTPAYIVFEWLLVEGLARRLDDNASLRTPGILKARETMKSRLRMESKHYLKTPTVFGFHGVYKRLARHLGIVDDSFRLRENGYSLVRIWETEQNLHGILDSATATAEAVSVRQSLQAAVDDGLKNGYTERSAGWQGWAFFAEHLAPGKLGRAEAACIRDLLLRGGEMTGEILRLVEQPDNFQVAETESEATLTSHLIPQASPDLAARLEAITAFEKAATLIEDAFDWLRFLSSRAGARPIRREEYAEQTDVTAIATNLHAALRKAEAALNDAPIEIYDDLTLLANGFLQAATPEGLFDAVLARHSQVQKQKPPEGKREWFEQARDGSIIVRVPYRLDEPPSPRTWWTRPYRLTAVRTFSKDLKVAAG